MIHDELPTVALHNVTETATPEWATGGHQIHRIPAAVGDELNVAARDRFHHPAGCELRFVPTADDATVEVTLSAAGPATVWPFWGAFQGEEPIEIGSSPTTVELSVPERIRELDGSVVTGAFDPRICRLRFDAWSPVAVHDVRGPSRPPTEEEVPNLRYLAHGTSITAGASASGPHLTYVGRVARRLGLDPINLGASGAAYCESAMADYVAERDDWDVATLALSVNMVNRGFTREQFSERVHGFVRTVTESNPDEQVVCVTLFPYHEDVVRDGDPERAAAFRAELRSAVESCDDGTNVRLVEGPDLMDATGLTTDLLHPGDAGMEAIGSGLAEAVRPRVE